MNKKAAPYQVPDKEQEVLTKISESIVALRLNYTTILNFIIVREGLEGDINYDAETGIMSNGTGKPKEKPELLG